MKKINLLLAGVIFTAFVFSTSSCKKDDDEDAVVATNGKATIKGRVTANTDETNADIETAPAGTILIAQIDSRELVANPSGDYSEIIYTTEVQGDGTYEFKIDANAGTVNVTIMPQDFAFDVRKTDNTTTPVSTKTEREIFTAPTQQNIPVVKGSTKIIDISYN